MLLSKVIWPPTQIQSFMVQTKLIQEPEWTDDLVQNFKAWIYTVNPDQLTVHIHI